MNSGIHFNASVFLKYFISLSEYAYDSDIRNFKL